MYEEERIFFKNFNMFVWTSGFQKSLVRTDFDMFVDEWTSANESPDLLNQTMQWLFFLCELWSRFKPFFIEHKNEGS